MAKRPMAFGGGYGGGGGPSYGGKMGKMSNCELRLLIHHKMAPIIIGRAGMTIKMLRETPDVEEISLPDRNAPERVLTIYGKTEDALIECLCAILEVIGGRGHQEERQGGYGGGSRGKPEFRDDEIRMLIHTSQAGGIIGRGGHRITEIREKTDAEIKVYTERCPMSSDRVAAISGDRDSIVKAVREIFLVCDENAIRSSYEPYDAINFDFRFASLYGGYADPSFHPKGPMMHGMGMGLQMSGGPRNSAFAHINPHGPPPGNDGPVETTQVSIPDDLAGTVIGKGGETIKRIRGESGCEVDIDKAKNEAEERVITISGSPMQVEMAQFLLQQTVKSSAIGRRYLQAMGM